MLKYYSHEIFALLLIGRQVDSSNCRVNRLILVLLPFSDSTSVLFSQRWDIKALLKPRLTSASSTLCGGSMSCMLSRQGKFLYFAYTSPFCIQKLLKQGEGEGNNRSWQVLGKDGNLCRTGRRGKFS